MLYQHARRLGRTDALDRVARPVSGAVAKAVPSGAVKDALSGTWLGHPLHPLLTDIPIGSWTSASILDLIGGRRSQLAADVLVAVGVVSALPTALAGLSDWADTEGPPKRIGVVHAACNLAALGLYTGSLGARMRGRRGRGVLLALAGMTVASAGGYLGGHLVFGDGVGVDVNAFEAPPEDWVDAAKASELEDRKPLRVRVGEAEVMLVRSDGRIAALGERCSHRGGPLHEGEIDRACVTCPWHGSRFRLDDGTVVRGPATAPQPAYETRIVDGRIQVKEFK
jgi:nitrite reductase/ring-hydroxylating ferredoxin subunit/uncharacterized membrane protein